MSKSKFFGPGLERVVERDDDPAHLALRRSRAGRRPRRRPRSRSPRRWRVVDLPVRALGRRRPRTTAGRRGCRCRRSAARARRGSSWSLRAGAAAAVAAVVVPAASSSSPPQPAARSASTRIGQEREPLHARDPTIAGMAEFVELEVGGRVVKVTNPDKVYFSARGRRSSTTSATTSRSARGSSGLSTSGRRS